MNRYIHDPIVCGHFRYNLEHVVDERTGDQWRIIASRVDCSDHADRLLKVFSTEQEALEHMSGLDLAAKRTIRLGLQNTLAQSLYAYDVVGFRLLIQEAEDVNAKVTESEATYLHIVCKSNSDDALDLIRLLLDRGADVNARDINGMTPLMWCSIWCPNAEVDIAALLLRSGADINARNNDGNTPLHVCGNVDIAALLLESGADINARNSYGGTPLHNCGNVDIAALLLESGADINARNNDGNTPLHVCGFFVIFGYMDIAALLLRSGADINARNSQGLTAEDLALQGALEGPDFRRALKAEVHQFLRAHRVRQALTAVTQQTTGTLQRTAADQRRSL